MSTRDISLPPLSEEQMRVHRAGEALNRDGASPAGALDLLAAIVESRDWERMTDAKGRSYEGRFRDFVEARSPYGLGYDADQLPKLLKLRHPHESAPKVAERMASMRVEVGRLLGEAVAPTTENRGRTITERNGRSRDTRPTTESDTATTVLARLKRDAEHDPEAAELAERVVQGEISSNAAAIAKGWRKPRVVVSSPRSVASALRKHMTPEELAELRHLLEDTPDA